MSVDPACLEYSNRRRGMDHDLYTWSAINDRQPVQWPGGKSVAIWPVISLEWFPMVPSDKPFRAPGHMQTAYPDYRHYTARDYGTRLGFWRLLDCFEQVGSRVSVACNTAIATRYPPVVEAIRNGGHEIIAHSTDMNGTIDSTLPEEAERALIRQSLDTLESAAGTRPAGWLSIARSQSFATPRLLAEAGLRYMCDWVNDELPFTCTTAAGPITNVPLNHELSDRQIINVQQQSVDSYVQQMQDAYALLAGEAAVHGGRMLPLHLTPYIMGLPYRIDAFAELVRWLAAQDGAWFARGSDLCDAVAG